MYFSKTSITIFSFLYILSPVTAFTVYWNAPTEQCLKKYKLDFTKLLQNYNITVNDGDKFQGDSITIFYEKQLGLYPNILTNGTFINGGIPQAGNLTQHLEQATNDIRTTIPDKYFNGAGVIDWEAWRPSWKFNWKPLNIYRDKSIEFAKEHNPSLSDKKIEELAKSQFEKAAKSYMMETLLLAQRLRPFARWGYYIFPDCYNYGGKEPKDFECTKKVKEENDKLIWLWKSSSALYPSIYLYDLHLKDYNFEQRTWKDNGKLQESIRVLKVASSETKLLPYVNYFLKHEVVPSEDFERIVAQIASIGADGIVIWGSSSSVNSKQRCDELENYISETLGPAIKLVSRNYNSCSKTICNGRGSCTWPYDKRVTSWKEFLKITPQFEAGDIVCRCKSKFAGKFCEKYE